ncbi:MAG: hypothetical protein LCH56_07700 [Proteobacteria bacterium]|nr:hypothetical protein [Pseudomonadota bacterium]
MLAITQFEVYVLDKGRWTIHARYGSDQRRAAIMDARTTEITTGLPTKVVAETYFPESNESELVTAYIGPKARELRESAKAIKRSGRSSGAPRHMAAPGVKQSGAGRRDRGLRQVLMQGLVAAMFSLVAATVSTAVLSWGLKRSIEAGLPVSATMSSTILTYAYATFFFFFFLSLSRSKLPLHRLLAYLWQQAPAKQEKPTDVKSLAAEIAPRIRAKQPSALALAEAERALDELKMMRGDPPPAPEVEVYDPPPLPQLEPGISPQLRELLNPETPAERKKREKREKKERAEKEAAEKAAAEAAKRVAAMQTAAAQAAAVKAAAEQAALAQASYTKAPPEPLPLERAVLRRFVADVIQPATAGTMPDDAVTRRGISLVIAGAAAALAETTHTSETGRLQLIEEALTTVGVTSASIGMFLHQHDELIAAPANATLVNLGRTALAKHLEGADVARILAVALAGWRTPFGQPTGPAVPAPIEAHTQDDPTHDIYVLTELRMGAAVAVTPEGVPDNAAEAARDAAMGLHNSVVRSVLGTHHGHEVKHTGTGIFAQFKQASAAITAAIEIQRRFTASDGVKLAIAVIENTNNDDPLLTPNVVHRAQTAAAQALDGEILAERGVQIAAGAGGDTAFESENDASTLVKIATEAETEAPALYKHAPESDFGSAPPVQTANAP